jgi:hypothetical protein
LPSLDDLIRAEESRARGAAPDPEAWKRLSLLYAAAGRLEDAYRALEGRDVGRDPVLRLLFAAAADRVNEHEAARLALDTVRSEWRAVHPLRVTHAAFCAAARGFQDYTPFPRDVFQAGQVVVVYFELDDFAVRVNRGAGFEVSIHADVGILTPPPTETEIRLPESDRYTLDLERKTDRPLDDLGLGLRVRLPAGLIPGSYRLRLTVEDRVARKFAVKFLDFRIQ